MGSSASQNGSAVGPNGAISISDESVRRALETTLSSDAFREADILRRFLRYSVEHSLRGEQDKLKEYCLGLEVFDRHPDFDPRLDPVVRMNARRLRTKLREYYQNEGATDPIRIEIPKGGYSAKFAKVQELPAQDAPIGKSLSRGARIGIIAAISAALALLVFGVLRRASLHNAVPHPIRSIAVLPFQNLSGDVSQEYLADGLTESLVTDLAQVHELRVISRTSVMTYKGTHKRLPEIARELNVNAVVEGSVARSAEDVRVTVQLIEAQTDTHIWAQTYEINRSNLQDAQNQVAQAIVRQVGVRLTPDELSRLKTVHLAGPEAHEEYLLGRYYWNKRTAEGFTKAVAYFQRATEKDTEYAAAYAGLADCYVLLAEYDLLPSQEILPKARQAANKALALDESLAEAHASLAAAKVDYEWDWRGAEQELRRATELNPGYATAHQWYAELLSEEGRHNEAVTEIKRAQELDPLSLIVNAIYGRILYIAGLTDPAIEQLRKTLQLDPNFSIAHYDLGRAYLRKGDRAQEIAEFKEAARLFSVSEREAAVGYAYAMSGQRAEALAQLKKSADQSNGKYVTWYGVAFIYSGLGQRDQAFACLEKAYQQHDVRLRDIKHEPFFENLHQDPRFAQLVHRIGL